MSVPKYDQLFNPLLNAMHQLGGSASVGEIEDVVANNLKLTDSEVNEIHRGNTTKLSYRLAWARNYLKRFGLLENSSRGIWILTKEGNQLTHVDEEELKRFVKNISSKTGRDEIAEQDPDYLEDAWKHELLKTIINISPNDFEQLCQRLLREAGFTQVKVTGKTGDGGIDGTGLIKIAGFLSFRVIFQCKRYRGSIGSQQIREFKGTMVGRADKGLFLTTGRFTRDATEEASRDGSVPIDLVDGTELAEKMKELNLGVRITTQERVEILPDWFKSF